MAISSLNALIYVRDKIPYIFASPFVFAIYSVITYGPPTLQIAIAVSGDLFTHSCVLSHNGIRVSKAI